MNQLTLSELLAIMPTLSQVQADLYLPYLNKAMERWLVDTPVRQAMFLAQLGHESGSLRYWREIASGKAYEGRADLGNIYPGDGVKYKGGGPMQLTGRANYRRCGKAIGFPLEEKPSLITEPEVGLQAAGWFWAKEKKLNLIADLGTLAAFKRVTYKINGGYNGYMSRLAYWKRAKKALGLT